MVSMNQKPSSKSGLKSEVSQKEVEKATRQSVIRLIFLILITPCYTVIIPIYL